MFTRNSAPAWHIGCVCDGEFCRWYLDGTFASDDHSYVTHWLPLPPDPDTQCQP